MLRKTLNVLKRIKRIFKRVLVFYYTFLVKLNSAATGSNLRVNKRSSVTKTTYLGSNVNFQGMYIVGSGKIEIGNNFHCGPDCMIMSHYHNYKDGVGLPYDNTYIVKDVLIEDNVWLGARVMVLPGVTIGEGAVVQAGSVVVADIPPLSIAGGHPAKVFSKRNAEHYQKLKDQKKFF